MPDCATGIGSHQKLCCKNLDGIAWLFRPGMGEAASFEIEEQFTRALGAFAVTIGQPQNFLAAQT